MADLKSRAEAALARSALGGRSATGFVKVSDAGLTGMITLRADLDAPATAAAVKAVVGLDMPEQRRIRIAGDKAVAWMSPDELMLIVPYAEARATVETLSTLLAGSHFAATDVSDARAVFRIEGPKATEVLQKLMPVDIDTLAPDEIRRSRLGQVAAAAWYSAPETLSLFCFRSVAQYAFGVLENAARPGSELTA